MSNAPAWVSGIITLLFATAFIIALCNPPGRSSGPQVGDVYGHLNPDRPMTPDETPHPWAGVFTIMEIRGGMARCRWVRTTGTNGDSWMELGQVLPGCTRLFKAPADAKP